MPPQVPFSSSNLTKVAPVVLHLSTSDDETVNVTNNTTKGRQFKLDSLVAPCGKAEIKTEDWGYPGYLNESQAHTLEQFRIEVRSRSKDFRDTLFTNEESHEDEYHALCRWLRSNKFNINKTLRKVEEATAFSAEARKNKYYHCTTDSCYALGLPPSIYLQQFPQFYHGVSKIGAPIFYAKAGIIDNKAIGCVTSTDGVLRFHWHDMFQLRNDTFQKLYESSGGTFQRYEILYVLDLQDLSTSQLNKQILNITKTQCKIDELCFPDSMYKMIIVNAPSCFPIFWRIVKAWIDPRNAAKVEIFGNNRSQWERRIFEFVDRDQLPSDYGGLEVNGTSLDIMRQQMVEQYNDINPDYEMIDELTTVMTFQRQEACQRVEVKEGMKLRLSIYTNSKSGGILRIIDKDGKLIDGIPSQGMKLIHTSGGDENEGDVSTSVLPTKYDLKELGINLDISGFYDVKISLNERLRGNFLLVTHYYKDVKKEQKVKKEIESIAASVNTKRVRQKYESIGVKSYSLGIGTFSLDDINHDDNQVEFYPYEYMSEC